jgi:23S rRNA (adenine2503-C2)-methyltransferase
MSLMPIEKRWPLPELMDAVRAYAETLSGRVTLAYVGIGGRNLTPAHARQLVALTAGLRVKISLIDVSDDSGKYAAPTEQEVAAFRDEMSRAGIPVVRRYSGGRDIGAACGTLSASQRGGQLVQLR